MLVVVYEIVEVGRVVYLFYIYFLLLGDVKKFVVYDVEVVWDGRSFFVRWVKVI